VPASTRRLAVWLDIQRENPMLRFLCLISIFVLCATAVAQNETTSTRPHSAEHAHEHGVSDNHHHEHGDEHRHEAGHPLHEHAKEPLGFDIFRGWLERWPHAHDSARGTPYRHPVGLEPAFLSRDLILTYRRTQADREEEQEFELEAEWAFTRRLGVAVEVPYVHIDPPGESSEQGFGDIAIAPRALLVETEPFLLSLNLEVVIPTGQESRGLGGGEAALAPSLSTWIDLGCWITLQGQVGTETGLESSDTEFFYKANLTWTIRGPALYDPGQGPIHGVPPGLVSAFVEYSGRTIWKGEDDGDSTGECLFGLSYQVTSTLEVRGGYEIPVGGPQEIDRSFFFGALFHF
jgi:hypothetical protein